MGKMGGKRTEKDSRQGWGRQGRQGRGITGENCKCMRVATADESAARGSALSRGVVPACLAQLKYLPTELLMNWRRNGGGTLET